MMNLLRIFRHLVVGLAATAAFAFPLWFLITTLGGKFGFWGPLESFRHILGNLPTVIPVVGGLGAAALLISVVFRLVFGRANAPGLGGYIAGVSAIVLAAGAYQFGNSLRSVAADVPPIHDISTDTANPPQFSASMIQRRERDGARNSVNYAEKIDPRSERPLPVVQAEAYPEIQPIVTTAEPALAFRAALEAGREMGWRIASESEDAMMFEGTAETFWFGFKDDIVVRVTAGEEGGAVVDARSVSRVGTSDLGANAARLAAFADRVRSSLGEEA